MASAPSSPHPRSHRKWKFTWESLAHISILRLFLFNSDVHPSSYCKGLNATLRPDQSLLLVSWEEEGEEEVVLRVPVPRVLIDLGSPVGFVAREDHIEVKLSLVLPVDHPIVMDFRANSLFGSELEEGKGEKLADQFLPLSLDSDLNCLSAGEVHFYCKACSIRLTRKHLRNFVELPSVNWREVADNWFGACCCSFGGISEKLVSKYVAMYACEEGTCLVDPASVILCKDDLESYTHSEGSTENTTNSGISDFVGASMHIMKFGSSQMEGMCCDTVNEVATISPNCLLQKEENIRTNIAVEALETQNDSDSLPCPSLTVANSNGKTRQETRSFSIDGFDDSHFNVETQCVINVESKLDSDPCNRNSDMSFTSPLAPESVSDHCCINKTNGAFELSHGRSGHNCSGSFSKTRESTKSSIDLKNQIFSHNGSLGSGFMIRTSNLSNDVRWVEFLCRDCSSLLGAYPSSSDTDVPVDGGIRLFKCYISSSTPIGGAHDVFRKHTLQRVFINLLLESATDELSFRTIVRDVRTKSPMLKVILVNSKVWCLAGYCLENEVPEPDSDTDLQPYAKVLYSDCCIATEANSREIEEWSTKNHADEVYMMPSQIKELTESLRSSQDRLPFSCSVLQGMSLSFIER